MCLPELKPAFRHGGCEPGLRFQRRQRLVVATEVEERFSELQIRKGQFRIQLARLAQTFRSQVKLAPLHRHEGDAFMRIGIPGISARHRSQHQSASVL